MLKGLTIQLPSPDSAIALAGEQEANLKLLAQQTGARLTLRGQELLISGTDKQAQLCQQLIYLLQETWQLGQTVSPVDILAAQQALNTKRQGEWQDLRQDVLATTRRGEQIRAKTFHQRQYVQAIRKRPLTFGIGPAGTGKTYLAAVLAVQALLANQYERLILTRPALEAGEKLGFYPAIYNKR